MSRSAVGVTYGLAAVAVFVALALAHGRLVLRRPPPVPHLLLLWVAIGAGLTASVLSFHRPFPVALTITNLAVYFLPTEVYIFVYTAAVGSLSIRLLVTLSRLDPLPDAFERTLARYPPAAFLDVRLESLVAQGLLVAVGQRYRITARGRRWARAGTALKRVLAVGAGG